MKIYTNNHWFICTLQYFWKKNVTNNWDKNQIHALIQVIGVSIVTCGLWLAVCRFQCKWCDGGGNRLFFFFVFVCLPVFSLTMDTPDTPPRKKQKCDTDIYLTIIMIISKQGESMAHFTQCKSDFSVRQGEINVCKNHITPEAHKKFAVKPDAKMKQHKLCFKPLPTSEKEQ